MVTKVITTTSRTGLFKFLGYFFKFKFALFFTLFIIISAFIIGISTDNPDYIVQDLGNRFLTPTLYLQQTSLKIIEQGYFFSEEKSIWKELLELWDILSQLWVIYILIFAFAWIIGHSFLSDVSRIFVNWSLGIMIFIVFQMLYISQIKDLSIWVPLLAFKDFLREKSNFGSSKKK